MLKGNKVPLGWAQSFETNNLTMFLEKDAVFPCHNWSIKIARIIWFGSISGLHQYLRQVQQYLVPLLYVMMMMLCLLIQY